MTWTPFVPRLLFEPGVKVPAALEVLLARRAVSSNPHVLRVASFTVTVRGMGVPEV